MEQQLNSDGTCLIKIKRERSFYGAAINFEVYVNEQYIAQVKNGATAEFLLTPGKYVIYVTYNAMNTVKSQPLLINIDSQKSISLVCGISGMTGINLRQVN